MLKFKLVGSLLLPSYFLAITKQLHITEKLLFVELFLVADPELHSIGQLIKLSTITNN